MAIELIRSYFIFDKLKPTRPDHSVRPTLYGPIPFTCAIRREYQRYVSRLGYACLFN
jgi:hypothetical protein